MLLFPNAARKVALTEWEKRHPGRPWPFDPPRTFGPAPRFDVHEVAEADELMLAATTGKLGLPVDPQTVEQKATALKALVAVGMLPPDFWARADWNNYRIQKQNDDFALSQAASSSDISNLEAWSKWAAAIPTVAAQVERQQTLAFQARVSGIGGGWHAINGETIGELSILLARYLGQLTPSQELANLISLKNIAYTEKWGAKAERYWTALVAKKAMDYKHHFEKEGY